MIMLINYIIIAGTNMAVKKIDYDEDILTKINGFGRWQLCLFMILWLPSAFSAFAVFMYSFIAFTPDHHCKISACGDTYQAQSSSFNFTIPHIETSDGLEYDQCKQYRLVQNYRYITIDKSFSISYIHKFTYNVSLYFSYQYIKGIYRKKIRVKNNIENFEFPCCFIL